MIPDLFYDEANRHLHNALRALADDDIPEMRAEIARAGAVGDRWEQALRDDANRVSLTQEGEQ